MLARGCKHFVYIFFTLELLLIAKPTNGICNFLLNFDCSLLAVVVFSAHLFFFFWFLFFIYSYLFPFDFFILFLFSLNFHHEIHSTQWMYTNHMRHWERKKNSIGATAVAFTFHIDCVCVHYHTISDINRCNHVSGICGELMWQF